MVFFGWLSKVFFISILLILIDLFVFRLKNFSLVFIICRGIGKLGLSIWLLSFCWIVVLLGVIGLYMWKWLFLIKVGVKKGKFWIWF